MSQEIAALQVVIEAQTAAFQKGIEDAQNQLQKLNNAASGSSKSVNAIGSAFSGIQGTFYKFNQSLEAVSRGMGIVTSLAGGLKSFLDAADNTEKFKRVLTELTGSLPRAEHMLNNLFRVADDADMSLGGARQAITRLAEATRDLGLSNNQLIDLTTTFFQIGKIGGRSAEELTSEWDMFATALQRGSIEGTQMERMLKSSPALLNILATALGVTQGELRKMADQGELSANRLVKGFTDSSALISEKAGKLPKTIGEGFDAIGRVTEKFFMDLEKALDFHGISKGIGAPLIELSKWLDSSVFPNMIALAKDVKAAWEGLKQFALGLAIVFVGPLTNAIVAVTAASLKLAMTPVGALVTLAGIALTLAANWKSVRDNLLEASEAVLAWGSAAARAVGASGLAESLDRQALKIAGMRDAYKAADEAAKKSGDAANDVGKQFNKAGDSFSKAKSAWDTWIESLKKGKEEIDVLPKKIEYLQDAISKEMSKSAPSLPFIAKLKADLEALKKQASNGDIFQGMVLEQEALKSKAEEVELAIKKAIAAGSDPTIMARLEEMKQKNVEAITGTKDYFAEYKTNQDQLVTKWFAIQEAIDKASAAGDQQALRNFTEQSKEIEVSMNKGKDAFQGLMDQIQQNMPKSEAYIAEGMARIKQAVADGLDPMKAKEMEQALRGVIPASDAINVALGNLLSQGVSELVDGFFTAGKSFSEFANNFLQNIAKMIAKALLLAAINKTLNSFGIPIKLNAKGDEYGGGTSLPQGIYTKPTLFKFANGGAFGSRMGMLGEAGPEAIMPLKRGSDGKLGVAAGGISNDVNLIVNNYASADVSHKETRNDDGSRTIELLIRNKVKEMVSDGSLDKPFSTNFGMARKGY